MKKYCLIAFIALGLLASSDLASAQAKIGYISLQELVAAMPEYQKAQADLQDYQKALSQQAAEYQMEFARKDSVYKKMAPSWSQAMQEVKKQELNDLYEKINSYNQKANQLLQEKEQTLLLPIQRKAVETTQAVAKENGYGYVLSKE